ncbi:MAG: hypothetical protein R6V47_06220 [Candidatus Delongbacteria bacterium]
MAKVKCSICNAKQGKRKCPLKNDSLICPVCCAKMRDEDCGSCRYFLASEEFKAKKSEKSSFSSPGSYFGSPVQQKTIMEASMDLMNSHAAIGSAYDKDTERFIAESFEFFNSEEFSEFTFSDEETDLIIKEFGEPSETKDWFHTEEGTKYYSNAVSLIMSDDRFRTFSKKLMSIFLKYYRRKDYNKAWLILSATNRIMESDFVTPFTILMFFRGISRWKLDRKNDRT